jgi:hypothetical protein
MCNQITKIFFRIGKGVYFNQDNYC